MGNATLASQASLEMAEQQFISFSYGKGGYSIQKLAESMGLTADEWDDLRPRITCLTEAQKQILDEYFGEYL